MKARKINRTNLFNLDRQLALAAPRIGFGEFHAEHYALVARERELLRRGGALMTPAEWTLVPNQPVEEIILCLNRSKPPATSAAPKRSTIMNLFGSLTTLRSLRRERG